jgi:hypothetical protein
MKNPFEMCLSTGLATAETAPAGHIDAKRVHSRRRSATKSGDKMSVVCDRTAMIAKSARKQFGRRNVCDRCVRGNRKSAQRVRCDAKGYRAVRPLSNEADYDDARHFLLERCLNQGMIG